MAEENVGSSPTEHPEHTSAESQMSAAAAHTQAGARHLLTDTGLEKEGPSLATAALVGVGVAIVEPELIPGILIGAGAWLAPKLLPAIGSMMRPVVKGVVKAGYSATMAVREAVAEVSEQVEDIVAEARAEHEAGNGSGTAEGHPAAAEPVSRQRRHPRTPTPVPATNL